MLCQEEEQTKQDVCIANEEKGAILKEAKRVHQEEWDLVFGRSNSARKQAASELRH